MARQAKRHAGARESRDTNTTPLSDNPIEVDIMCKRKVVGPGLVLVLVLLLNAVRVNAQSLPGGGSSSADTGWGGGAITGMVLSATGERFSRHVSVRLRSMAQGDRVTTTDDKGNFVFRGVPKGDYVVVIDKEEGFEPFSQNVSISPFSGDPYLNIRLRLKGADQAESGVINAELVNVPKDALTSYQKALQSAQAKKNTEAIAQLKQAIAEYPDFMLAYNELGVQYLAVGDLTKAEESLNSALKLKPDAFEPLMNYGITLVRLNRFAEAVPQLRAAIKQKEQSAVGHFYLGRALAYQQRYDDAIVELNRALQLGGEELKEGHRYLAAIYNQKGDKQRAISELETYLKLAPNSKDADHLRELIRDLRNSK
jgi:Tfp pilus assembly protein PilF